MPSLDTDRCDRVRKQRGVAAIPSFHLNRGNLPQPKKTGLDFDSISQQIVSVIRHGIAPLVIGTTGESPTLRHSEEKDLIDVARETVGLYTNPDIPLIVGAGSNDTEEACEYTSDAVKYGADAILSVFPYYNKPSEDGQLDHFGLVAEAAEGKPVIIYNIPGRTGGRGIAPKTLIQLANEYPNIVGVKECNGEQLRSSVISAYPEGFKVWTGEDGQIVDHMRAGALGAISVLANVDPEGVKRIIDLCAEGNFDEANIVHGTRSKLIELLFREGNPNGVKGACHLLDIGNNEARLPIKGASINLLQELEAEMLNLKLIR
jgi:4-hydroxy-tetrahydrodipicolinate synthase